MCKCTIFLTLALATMTLAQDTDTTRVRQIATKEQTREFTERFLNTLITQRPFDAFSLIKAVVPDMENDIETTRQTTERLIEQVRPIYGKPIKAEMLAVKSLGESFIRYDYLLKFERNALHCRMVYYMPVRTWIPVALNFDTNIGDLFEELGK